MHLPPFLLPGSGLYNRAGKYALIRIVEVSINIGLNLFFLYYCPRHTRFGIGLPGIQ